MATPKPGGLAGCPVVCARDGARLPKTGIASRSGRRTSHWPAGLSVGFIVAIDFTDSPDSMARIRQVVQPRLATCAGIQCGNRRAPAPPTTPGGSQRPGSAMEPGPAHRGRSDQTERKSATYFAVMRQGVSSLNSTTIWQRPRAAVKPAGSFGSGSHSPSRQVSRNSW